MRLMKFLSVGCAICISTNCFAQSKSEVDPKQAIQLIKEFYIAYNTAWSSDSTPQELNEKLRDLKLKYCSIALMIDLSDDIDHDLLINDQYTDVAHLKTLTVHKDSGKKNSYTVSYIAPTTDPTNKAIEEK
jgi:hypothetical protein